MYSQYISHQKYNVKVLKLGNFPLKDHTLPEKLIPQYILKRRIYFQSVLWEKQGEICRHLFGVLYLQWNTCDCCLFDRVET